MTIGSRIKEERTRLGMNQSDFAALAGTTKKSQISYEKGVMPDASYLASIAAAGVDIQYIVTGERKGGGIGEAAVHQAVLDAADLLSLNKSIDVQQLAKAVVKLCTKGYHQSFTQGQTVNIHAPGGNAAGRDIVVNPRNGEKK